VNPLCSRNARSRKTLVGRAQLGIQPGYPLEGEKEIRETRVVHCSRSAHDQNVLARRAQWDHHGYPSIR